MITFYFRSHIIWLFVLKLEMHCVTAYRYTHIFCIGIWSFGILSYSFIYSSIMSVSIACSWFASFLPWCHFFYAFSMTATEYANKADCWALCILYLAPTKAQPLSQSMKVLILISQTFDQSIIFSLFEVNTRMGKKKELKCLWMYCGGR